MEAEIKRQMAHGGVIDTPRERERFFRYLEVLSPRHEPLVIRGRSRRRREFMARCLHHYGPGQSGGHFQLLEPTALEDTDAGGALENAWKKSAGGTLFVDDFDDAGTPFIKALKGVFRHVVRTQQPTGQQTLPLVSARLILGRRSESGADERNRSAASLKLEALLRPVTVDMWRLKPGAAGDGDDADESASTGAREELERWLGKIFSAGGGAQGGNLFRRLRDIADRELSEIALQEAGGNRKRAAELLGISTATLSRRLSPGKGKA